jgi:iron complex outermembrane receptor protein
LNITGVKTEVQDSNTMRTFENSNLGELLMQHSSLYVKSNGASGLSSVSIRGTSTSHTAVLWNGFNLQNPMNGGMDFSLLPVSFANKIRIQYNGMSSLYGSGAIGGAIQLANLPEFGKGLDVSLGGNYGSFSNYSGDAKLNWSNSKTAFSLKTFYHEGKNDFPFINTATYGAPKVRQTHAQLQQWALLFDNANKINDKNLLTYRLWYQTAQRQLPPNMTQETSDANQYDQSIRSALEWKNEGKIHQIFVRSALFVEDYKYEELSKAISSASRSIASISEAEVYCKVFPFQTLNAGLHYRYTTANTDYYQNRQHQQEVALFVSWLINSKKDNWKLNLSLRQEYANDRFVPIMPSVGMDIRIYKELFAYANFSRNFRMPTLNDLYWYPGGNPDLKPESGYAEEIGLKQLLKWKKTQFNYSVSVFNNNVENWIVWLPSGYYWSPQNILSVWSRGTEASMGFTYYKGKALLDISGKFSYVKATTQKSNNESAIGKQLIYTPEVNAGLNLNIGYGLYLFGYNMEYVSARYTSPDNSDKIKPYLLGNIQISKEFRLKQFAFSAFIHIDNLWNQTYQTIAWQAMPGINFKTGIKIDFKYNPLKLKNDEKS